MAPRSTLELLVCSGPSMVTVLTFTCVYGLLRAFLILQRGEVRILLTYYDIPHEMENWDAHLLRTILGAFLGIRSIES